MERRLGKFATGLMVGVIALEGCGGQGANSTVAPVPPSSPDATLVVPTAIPSPTEIALPSKSPDVIITPTPSASPIAPSPEVSPSPKPKNVDSIINADSHPKVKADTITKAIEVAYKNNPSAENTFPHAAATRNFKMCEAGLPGDKNIDLLHDKFNGCFFTISKALEVYNSTQDDNFYNIANNSYNYFIQAFPELKQQLDDALVGSGL